jgi:hypothetical protein
MSLLGERNWYLPRWLARVLPAAERRDDEQPTVTTPAQQAA